MEIASIVSKTGNKQDTAQILHLPTAKPRRKLPKQVGIGLFAVAMLGTAGYFGNQWVQFAMSHEETDDAYITGHLHQVSTRVNGTVEKVMVDDNDHVTEGQVLVLLDPRDYKAKADQALANLPRGFSEQLL